MLDRLRRQLRSVIEWDNPLDEDIFYRWSENGDEIKNASKLIVGPGQGCIFVYRGEIRSVHTVEGIYQLDTDNIPFLTTLIKFMNFFESEHKVGIYFFKTAQLVNQKWGSTSAIKYLDNHYNFPVSLKAYGNFSYQISEPRLFFSQIVGEKANYTTDEFRDVMNSRIIHPISDFLAEGKYSVIEIDSLRNEISIDLSATLERAFKELGFEMTDFRIEGTNFDDDTLERIQRIANVTTETLAAREAGISYTELQQLEALKHAAQNEGGAAGAGVGLGAGIGLGQQMTEQMTRSQHASTEAEKTNIFDILEQLKKAHDAKLLSDEEFTQKKRELLERL